MKLKFTSREEEVYLGAVLAKILMHINKIERYSSGLAFERYIEDDLTQDALATPLRAIAEHLKAVTSQPGHPDRFGLMEAYPDIGWHAVLGDADAHQADSLPLSGAWQAVTVEIPALKKAVMDVSQGYPIVKNAMGNELALLKYELHESREAARFMMREKETPLPHEIPPQAGK